MEAWNKLKLKRKHVSKIRNVLDKGHVKKVEDKENIKTVVESLSYTACQGLAQRGYVDCTSSNRGNFIKSLNDVAMYNKTVAKKIDGTPLNTKYTHHDIQNEIFSIMARRYISAKM